MKWGIIASYIQYDWYSSVPAKRPDTWMSGLIEVGIMIFLLAGYVERHRNFRINFLTPLNIGIGNCKLFT